MLVHEKQWHLCKIVSELQHTYPDVEFHYHFDGKPRVGGSNPLGSTKSKKHHNAFHKYSPVA